MRLTAKGRYAVTAMLDLAVHKENGPISLADISTRQGISLSYLEQLFAKLRRNGLVKSVRGPGGGYRLSREGGQISVAEIVDAVNEAANDAQSDQNEESDITQELWTELSEQIHQFLSEIDLASIVAKRQMREAAERSHMPRQEEVSRFPTHDV